MEHEEELECVIGPTVDGVNTFYYAYCNTEGRRIGGATNQRVIAQNSASYHADRTGHETSVDEDKSKAIFAIPCGGNACKYIHAAVLEGPTVRLRNSHPDRSVEVEVYWASILGGQTWTTHILFPGDDTTYPAPDPAFLGVSKIKTKIV